MAETLFWYDYETTGLDSRLDRVCQFAGQRTDLDLNPIGAPISLYCQPTHDVLPSPDACLITGLTPQYLRQHGVTESVLSDAVRAAMAQASTCTLGYNSLRFDDEFTRFLLYRNLVEPYGREWQNGNSRWDALNLLRAAWVLRPEGLVWPESDEKKVSLRLDFLCQANGIKQTQAHDALSDVQATIELVRLVRRVQPKLYEFLYTHRVKQAAHKLMFDKPKSAQALVYISSYIARERGHCAFIKPLFTQASNKNVIVCFDLSTDPRALANLSDAEFSALLTYKEDQDSSETDKKRKPSILHYIAINKCPVLVPGNTLTDSINARFGLDPSVASQHAAWLDAHPDFSQRLLKLSQKPRPTPEETDADLALYTGGFIGDSDRARMEKVHRVDATAAQLDAIIFDDKRLNTLLLRYRARNFPESLSAVDSQAWSQYQYDRICADNAPGLNITRLQQRLTQLRGEPCTPTQEKILHELEEYASQLQVKLVENPS